MKCHNIDHAKLLYLKCYNIDHAKLLYLICPKIDHAKLLYLKCHNIEHAKLLYLKCHIIDLAKLLYFSEENMEVLVNYSLVVLEIRANQFGEYVCVASNIADTISSSARIQTEGKKLFSSNS